MCDLESVSFALRPIVQHFSHHGRFVDAAGTRFDFEPNVGGLGYCGTQVFERKAHAWQGRSRKYLASRSTCRTPGFLVCSLAIFSSVRRGTPLPAATSGHEPFLAFSSAST